MKSCVETYLIFKPITAQAININYFSDILYFEGSGVNPGKRLKLTLRKVCKKSCI